MIFIAFYHFILGYVDFTARKGKTERFINLCTKEKISLWALHKQGDRLHGRMHIKDYKKIIGIANRSQVILSISNRHGLPHIIDRYKDRLGLPIGVMLFFAINIFLGMFIWDIKVTGNEEIMPSQVISQLEKQGVAVGTNYKDIEFDLIEQELLTQFPEFAYINIQLDGCYATVDVREKYSKVQDPNAGYPTNIVAGEDGYLLNIETYSGKTVAVKGEAITKGDIIISGIYQMKNGRTDFVNASGKAIAETQHTYTKEVPYTQTEIVRSDTYDTKRTLSIFGVDIPLYLTGASKPYYKELYRYQVNINDKNLPIAITTANFYQVQETTIKLTKEQALEECREDLTAQINEELRDAEIIKVEEKVEYLDDRVVITGVITCHEDISIEQRIILEDAE